MYVILGRSLNFQMRGRGDRESILNYLQLRKVCLCHVAGAITVPGVDHCDISARTGILSVTFPLGQKFYL